MAHGFRHAIIVFLMKHPLTSVKLIKKINYVEILNEYLIIIKIHWR